MRLLSSLFARLPGRRKPPAVAPTSPPIVSRWADFALELPADWVRIPANKSWTKLKAQHRSDTYASVAVMVLRGLWPDDTTSAAPPDAWAGYDAVGEAAFRARFEQIPGMEPRILVVRKSQLASHRTLYVEYELHPAGRPEAAVMLRAHYLLHEHLWYGVLRATLLREPHHQLVEMTAIVRTFRFTGGWAGD